jgi:hypothetical protein
MRSDTIWRERLKKAGRIGFLLFLAKGLLWLGAALLPLLVGC